jgi:hypothetical protein
LDSNQRRQSHQIYSLARLATPEHARDFRLAADRSAPITCGGGESIAGL